MLPQSDYNSITSGSNGYTASAGYNLVTGLGTPVANLLVPDLIAYQRPGTVYSGATVGSLQDAGIADSGASSSSTIDVFSVFDTLTVLRGGLRHADASSAAGALTAIVHRVSTHEAGLAAPIAKNTAARFVGDLPRDPDGVTVRSIAERSTTIAAALAQASAAVDQVLGTLETDSAFDGSTIDELAVDLLSPQTRRSHRASA
jgi:hypothetical protein